MDLDGTIVDMKHTHHEAFSQALSEFSNISISYEEHLKNFDGKSTKTKLKWLTEHRELSESLHESIWKRKQQLTEEAIDKFEPDLRIQAILKQLREEGYKLGCCTNSIRKNTETVLKKKGFCDFFDFILTNEDVNHSKPHPEMYLRAFIEAR